MMDDTMQKKIARPQQYIAKLEERIRYNDRYAHYFFELIDPHRLSFKAGQYISIKVADNGTRRSYSICSTPDVDHGFELLVENVPNGVGSVYFESLQFGDAISMLAPLGQFVVNDNREIKEFVFVATGSGIAPYRSMILELLQQKKETRPIALYWGMRYAKDFFWLDEITELQDAFPNFHFEPTLSQPEDEWPLSRGRVTDLLKAHQFNDGTHFYLCGGQNMIEEMRATLVTKQIAKEAIHFEKFF